jgi:hypothetical protein
LYPASELFSSLLHKQFVDVIHFSFKSGQKIAPRI